MNRTRFIIFTLVSVFLVMICPAMSYAATMVQKGSSINQYDPDHVDTWWTSGHDPSVSVGTEIWDGYEEFHPAASMICNWTSFGLPRSDGQYIAVPQVSVSTATVVERRYVQSGTVTTPGEPNTTIVASTVEYYIQSGPAQAIGVTLRRSDWESESGDRTGTTFTYFRANPSYGTPYFHGHVDGDIYGVIRYIGTDAQGHPITETRRTSIKGMKNTKVSTIVWDNSVISVTEPEVVHTNVEIQVRDGIQYIVGGVWYYCLGDTGNIELHTGTSFYLPAFNVGHYRGSYYGTIEPDYGLVFSYDYIARPWRMSSCPHNYPPDPGYCSPHYFDVPTYVVPRLIGLTSAGAQALILNQRMHRFSVGTITTAYSGVYPAGRVISQSLSDGSLVESTYPNYTPIGLVVSLGPVSGNNTITATSGGHGSITPSGAVMVAYSGSQAFVMAPDQGYKVLDVLVDGASVLSQCVTVSLGMQYTFENVTVDHTITAQFEPGYCACDLNNDGRCNMRDWLIFGQDWGRTNCKIK